ncbi:MAG: hypothetical protein QNJ19_11240 [Woeseiaceae bacterium]|nr:hypothetical protein [Woeseiaceae bacterium]
MEPTDTTSRATTVRRLALAAALLLYWPYAAVLSYVEFGATCNMGGESLLPSVFIGLPIIGFAATATWLLRASVPINEAHRWIVLSALGLAALVTVPQVLTVSVLGNHPCGAEFNAFRAFMEQWDRWIPVVNLAFIGFAGFIAIGPFVRTVAERQAVALETAASQNISD